MQGTSTEKESGRDTDDEPPGEIRIVGKILENPKYTFGYNAQSGEYGDLVSQGVIDPTKVVRCALQDAASIAGLLITTEAMVAEVERTLAR